MKSFKKLYTYHLEVLSLDYIYLIYFIPQIFIYTSFYLVLKSTGCFYKMLRMLCLTFVFQSWILASLSIFLFKRLIVSVPWVSDLCQIIVCYLQGLNGSSRTLQSLQRPATSISIQSNLLFCSSWLVFDIILHCFSTLPFSIYIAFITWAIYTKCWTK